MLDLRKFTEFSDNYEQKIPLLINEYYSCVFDIFNQHDIKIGSLNGDGIFGYKIVRKQDSEADDAISVVHAALKIMHEVKLMVKNKKYSAVGLGVGIAIGRVYFGFLGTPEKRYLGILGHSVNISSRFCNHAIDGQVFITKEINTLIHDSFICVRMKPYRPKNVYQELEYHWVLRRARDNEIKGHVGCGPECKFYPICFKAYEKGRRRNWILTCESLEYTAAPDCDLCEFTRHNGKQKEPCKLNEIRSKENEVLWQYVGDTKQLIGKEKPYTCCDLCNNYLICHSNFAIGNNFSENPRLIESHGNSMMACCERCDNFSYQSISEICTKKCNNAHFYGEFAKNDGKID